MNTKPLEKFAQAARRQLHEQVSARLEQVLRTDSPELRAKAGVVAKLNKQIAQSSRTAVVERVAYTWFNRFCALRYMDANRYTRVGIVSPADETHTQPEILQEAKAGHIDPDLAPFVDGRRVFDLLHGRTPVPDAQTEAYRRLLVASCNQYHAVMPFLFEKIDDYTELLMPDDLLSAASVLTATRQTLTAAVCQDVEVIGWLYQFYISEKKDEVIGAKKPISPENIPAATQLFTPDWIVRYLVQNSLGRLWLTHRPHSRLAEQMEFYIRPDETSDFSEKSDVWRITSPETLTLCDPAAGSGHMLTYAFDLLYAIYEEEGYNPPDIPRLILQKNLVGLEIDERAAALAAFALMMKARARDRRFLRRGVLPAITVLHPLAFTDAELDQELPHLMNMSFRAVPGEESFPSANPVIPNPRRGEESFPFASAEDSSSKTRRNDMGGGVRHDTRADIEAALRHDLNLFREADNLGSLLRPRLSAAHLARLRAQLDDQSATDLFAHDRRRRLAQALAQAIPLARRYDVVIANPPYMGSKNMNDRLKKFAESDYPDSKSDFFAMFIERGLDLVASNGYSAMVTMQSWMFLSSYERLREKLLKQATIECMVHMDNMVMGIAFGTAATVWQKAHRPDFKGHFSYVYYEDLTPENRPREFPMQNDRLTRAAAADFQKIPGSPIAYWLSHTVRDSFVENPHFSDFYFSDGLTKTGNNEKYLRFYWEVNINDTVNKNKYRICVKGGPARSYFGNTDVLVNWEPEAREHYRSDNVARITPEYLWESSGISWTKISSRGPTFRWFGNGMIAETGGPAIFCNKEVSENALWQGLGFLASKVSWNILTAINPTLNFQTNDVLSLPINLISTIDTAAITKKAYELAVQDWDSFETSIDFATLPLLQCKQSTSASLAATYTALRRQWQAAALEMRQLEEENNRLFIAAYGLQDELTPDVPLSEITLTCNPHYRYGGNPSADGNQLSVIGNRWPEVAAQWPKGEEGLELRLLADTLREFISYAVGCMFGRYSLDAPGLILANQGETVAEYVEKVRGHVSFRRDPPLLSFRGVFDEESTALATAKDSSEDLGMTMERMARNDRVDGITFLPDKDNAIPILDGEWFSDDISERFKKFLRLTFGDTHYADNLAFLEAALGRDIRSYFLRDFYDHHVRLYKKRPIYWLFSSPKGSFNALIYMHRYRPDTVSIILNDYLREFRAKLDARKNLLAGVSISATASARDRTRALKEVADIDKTLKELRDYEDDVLYPLATRQVAIDLDDGVKVNYNKLGPALKKVAGLSE